MINFKFRLNKIIKLELPFLEHIEELRYRIFFLFNLIILLTCLIFTEINNIISFLTFPILNIKFFQLSPEEYFISTIKITFYISSLFTSPFIINQIILFLFPGLTNKELKIFIILLFNSLFLFSLSLIFSYYILIPIILKFFLNYTKEIIEPFWSFNEYFNFIFNLFYNIGFIFQIPIFQIFIYFLKIISFEQMINFWKYILLIATILAAILTPSTDPLTQLLFSFIILILYGIGLSLIILLKKLNYLL